MYLRKGKKDKTIKIHEFLSPVILVPQDRSKNKFKMRLYERQTYGLYSYSR